MGAVKATVENNYKLAAFRALLFVAGSIAVLQAGTSSGTLSSQGRQDTSLARLLEAADDAVAQQGPGKGAVYGTRVHSRFSDIVDSWGDSNFTTEQSYLNGVPVKYGTPGSIRVDVAEGPVESPIAVYDLKTGAAELTSARILQLQQHIPGGASTPIIQFKPSGQQ